MKTRAHLVFTNLPIVLRRTQFRSVDASPCLAHGHFGGVRLATLIFARYPSTMNAAIATELNDRAVKHLVDAHTRLDEPLLLAIRYKLADPGIHLFEVLDGFPGDENEEPEEIEFGPSPEVRMTGTLKLVLVNAQQFRALVHRNAAVVDTLKKDGRVEFYVQEG